MKLNKELVVELTTKELFEHVLEWLYSDGMIREEAYKFVNCTFDKDKVIVKYQDTTDEDYI